MEQVARGAEPVPGLGRPAAAGIGAHQGLPRLRGVLQPAEAGERLAAREEGARVPRHRASWLPSRTWGTPHGAQRAAGTTGANRLTTGVPTAAARWAGPVLPTTRASARSSVSRATPIAAAHRRRPSESFDALGYLTAFWMSLTVINPFKR